MAFLTTMRRGSEVTHMRHVIIYSWEEVKKVLENELEDDKYRVQVKPCLLKKGIEWLRLRKWI